MQKNLIETTLTDAEKREQNHAKLLVTDGQQVLVYLYRDEQGALSVIVQVWVALTDEQLRFSFSTQSDEESAQLFDNLNDESIAMVLQELGLPEILADLRGGAR